MTLRRTGERKKGIIIKLVEEVPNKLSGFRYRKLMSGSGLVWSGPVNINGIEEKQMKPLIVSSMGV